jgi:ferric iron reductase protein FhuF
MVSGGVGQMLVLFQPAGTMEEFFAKRIKLGKEIPHDMEHRLKTLFEEHGMKVVGPPLQIEA